MINNSRCQVLYLVTFNIVSMLCWLFVGGILLFSHRGGIMSAEGLKTEQLWGKIFIPLAVAQTLAIMECVHAATKIVNSSVLTTATQVFSRLHIVWIIWRFIPDARESIFFVTAVSAWCGVELVRYPFYAINCYKGVVPYLLKWLRYSAFLLLYPVGIFSEIACIWISLDFLKATRSLRAYPYPMPNVLNFELDLFLLYRIVLIAYIPGAIHLYRHMLNQRSKALYGGIKKLDEQKD